MPYAKKEELPDAVKKLPMHGQEIWMAAYNSALEQYKDEEKAFATAWAAVERKYRKGEDGKWAEVEEGKMAVPAVLKEVPDPPDEFLLLPQGKIEIEGDDPAFLDAPAAEEVIRNFERRGNEMVIDYEHQTLEGSQAPAAGWIAKLIYRAGEGLYAAVKWTEKAKEYLRNREYRYFSPVFLLSLPERKVTRIFNVALTNSPRVNNLKPIMAKLLKRPNFTEKEDVMEKLILKLKQILGLAAEAAEDKITETVEALVNKVKGQEGKEVVACREVMEAIGAKEETGKDEVLRIIAGLKAPATAAAGLSKEVTSLKGEIATMKRDQLVALALKDGKTSPEEIKKWGNDLALKDPEQYKLIVLSRPVGSIIPMKEMPKGPEGGGGAAESEFDRLVTEAQEKKKLSRAKAISVVAKENPKAHQEWLAAQEKAQGF